MDRAHDFKSKLFDKKAIPQSVPGKESGTAFSFLTRVTAEDIHIRTPEKCCILHLSITQGFYTRTEMIRIIS